MVSAAAARAAGDDMTDRAQLHPQIVDGVAGAVHSLAVLRPATRLTSGRRAQPRQSIASVCCLDDADRAGIRLGAANTPVGGYHQQGRGHRWYPRSLPAGRCRGQRSDPSARPPDGDGRLVVDGRDRPALSEGVGDRTRPAGVGPEPPAPPWPWRHPRRRRSSWMTSRWRSGSSAWSCTGIRWAASSGGLFAGRVPDRVERLVLTSAPLPGLPDPPPFPGAWRVGLRVARPVADVLVGAGLRLKADAWRRSGRADRDPRLGTEVSRISPELLSLAAEEVGRLVLPGASREP